MKKYIYLLLAFVFLFGMYSCKKKHVHEKIEATCTKASHCITCNETFGEPLEHDFKEATYELPKTCKVCGYTEGTPLESIKLTVSGEEQLDAFTESTYTIFTESDVSFEVKSSDESIIKVISVNGNSCLVKTLSEGTATLTFSAVDNSSNGSIEIEVLEESFNISYVQKDKVVLKENPESYKSSSLPLKLETPTKSGFEFLGWAFEDEYNNSLIDEYDTSLLWSEIPEGTKGDIVIVPIFGYPRLEIVASSEPIIDLNDEFSCEAVKKYLPVSIRDNNLVWESSNSLVASIDSSGNVTPLSVGYTTIKLSIEGDTKYNITMGLTVVEDLDSIDDALEFFIRSNETEVVADVITVTGYQFIYTHKLLGSVSKYGFFEHVVNESIQVPVNPENRPGTVYPKYYVTVHDTASSGVGSDAKAHATYVQNGGGGTSWHYSAGDTAIYHQMPDNERAYHAGDGSRQYHLNDTGLAYNPEGLGKITISSDGYYEIDGVKTLLLAPTRPDKSIALTSDINDYGIRLENVDGKWYMGDSWWSKDYNRIANTGGNSNSIGIETMVDKGSDVYLTWQKTAKLVAHLLVDNGLSVDDVKTHHYFSGKNCPQTMRDNGYWFHFLELVACEYEYLTTFSDCEVTFTSLDKTYVNNRGRVIKRDNADHYSSYEVTVTKNGVSKTITLTVLIKGNAHGYRG